MIREKTLSLIHISYDPISAFELRIPENRLEEEDSSINRICLAPSIEDCINAKPGRGRAIQVALERNIPLILYVYQAEIPCDAEYLVRPSTVCKEFHVKDAIINQEYWVTEIPEFHESMLLVADADFTEIAEVPYPTINRLSTHPVDKLPEFCAQVCTNTINKHFSKNYSTDLLLIELPDIEEWTRDIASETTDQPA